MYEFVHCSYMYDFFKKAVESNAQLYENYWCDERLDTHLKWCLQVTFNGIEEILISKKLPVEYNQM